MATYSWIGGNGSYSVATNWLINGLPASVAPGNADDVVIAAPGTYSVVSFIGGIGSLTIANPAATLIVDVSTTIFGNVSNAGSILLAPGVTLQAGNGTSTFGGGVLQVSAGDVVTIDAVTAPGGFGRIINSGGSITIVNTLDNTGATFGGAQAGHVTFLAGVVGGTLDNSAGNLTFGNIFHGVHLADLTFQGQFVTELPSSLAGTIEFTGAGGTGAGTVWAGNRLALQNAMTLDNVTIFLGSSMQGGGHIDASQSLTIGSGATVESESGSGLFAQSLGIGGGAIVNNGWINVHRPMDIGGGSFTNNGVLAVGDQHVGIGMFSGFVAGTASIGTGNGFTTNNGTILVGGGNAVFSGAVLGGGIIALSAHGSIKGTVEIAGGYGQQLFAFLDASASTLKLNAPSGINAIIGFRPGNTIELVGTPATVSFSNTTLSIASGGTTIAGFVLPDVAPGWSFQATTDAFANTFITEIPCFAAGTRLATADGEVPVEHLREGDVLRTASGALAPVRWIGRRTVNCARHPRPWDVLPVRVSPDAFAPGQPLRDLWLSPDHAVFHAGHLIPVRYLLNGRSICQVEVASVTYLHVELPAHDLVLAEGLACESYLDTGNRAAFAGAITDLHPDFARAAWTRAACAPLVTDGPIRTAARRHLLARAEAGGHRLTNDPGLVITSGPRILSPFVDGPHWRLAVPHGGEIHLGSRAFIPAHTRADEDDTRRLGVAIANPRIDGRAIPLDHPCFGAGWHVPEPDWRWSDGMARLLLHGGAEFAFDLVMAGRYWADCAPAVLPTRALVA